MMPMCNQLVDGGGVGRCVDMWVLRTAYSDFKPLRRTPVTVLLSPAALAFLPKLVLNIVPKCLVLKRNRVRLFLV